MKQKHAFSKVIFQIIVYLISSFSYGFAQSYTEGPLRRLDYNCFGKAKAELIYQYDGIDPISKKYHGNEYMLQISDTTSFYLPYGEYKVDSVLVAWEGKGKTRKEFSDFTSRIKSLRGESILHINSKNNILIVRDFYAGENYIYTEVSPQLKWILNKEVRKIRGRICRKATLDYAGRQWTAWYDPKLPISEGPWKFHGLPGAIIRISDKTGSHSFELIQVRSVQTPIIVPKRTRPHKISRKELDKLRALYATNPGAVFGNSPLAPRDLNGRVKKLPMRKRGDVYINPIHLD